MRKLKEKRKAKEEAKKKVEEEAARQAAEEEQKRQEAATWAASARKVEEEAAEKRRRIAAAAAAQSRQGPSPGEATTSARRVEVEIPRVVRKGNSRQRAEAISGDPDDGDDGNNDNNKGPCERCKAKKIPCAVLVLATAFHGERTTGRARKSDGTNPRRQLGLKGGLDSTGAGAVTPGPSRIVSEKPRNLKRRRIVEHSDKEEEEEEEVEKEGEGAEVEDEAPALKKAKTAASEKGKEKEM
ncbi:hypothetical protein F5876DRAFT_82020 [Lentinula aff. lateritia]|uniref:Uncharacterized protein n=1 Tax=Lentinula aff. lateritia TaxID=2804960 RepID=A0ACC1TKT7_9AGAR|nr:hypothetical protein F5876DRAFT_82020 [Lentinula aff. lateritia]